MNLGVSTVKRTSNTTIHKGIKSGLKEAGKAFVYYTKNTKSYYKKVYSGPSLLKSTAIDSLSKATSSYIRSRNTRALYRRTASGGGYYYERLRLSWK